MCLVCFESKRGTSSTLKAKADECSEVVGRDDFPPSEDTFVLSYHPSGELDNNVYSTVPEELL